MKKQSLGLSIFLLATFVVIFQNCGDDASFSKADKDSLLSGGQGNGGQDIDVNEDEAPDINDELGNGEQEDYGIISEICRNRQQKVHSRTIYFPHPGKVCEWEKDGNLSQKDAYFRARIEQVESLGLPVGAVVCGASFDFPEQQYRYDDYFALLFNRSIIAAGYDFEGYLKTHYFGLLDYSWTDIRDIPMEFGSNRETIYCPEIPGAQSSCDFPGHDTQGTIKISYDDRFIQSVMSTGVPSDHSFTLVTFGDNNQSNGQYDCSHSDIEFDVTVKYVLTQ